jgi:hypothetical protein
VITPMSFSESFSTTSEIWFPTTASITTNEVSLRILWPSESWFSGTRVP